MSDEDWNAMALCSLDVTNAALAVQPKPPPSYKIKRRLEGKGPAGAEPDRELAGLTSDRRLRAACDIATVLQRSRRYRALAPGTATRDGRQHPLLTNGELDSGYVRASGDSLALLVTHQFQPIASPSSGTGTAM
jgi:hypothetical protein